MNFAHYYNILQQMEKPIFVFENIDNSDIIKLYLKQLEDYLIEKGADGGIKRKMFNITVEFLQECCKRNYIIFSKKDMVKIYDNPNSYFIYCAVNFQYEDYASILNVINFFESRDRNLLKKLYKDVIQGTIKKTSFLELIDMARMGNNHCYFNITTTKKDYFTLEIIAVIHKIIA